MAQTGGDRPTQAIDSGGTGAEHEMPPAKAGRPSKPLRYAGRYGSPDAATRLGHCNQASDEIDLAGDGADVR